MAESGESKLLSLLFGGGRTLVNFKFLPGDQSTNGDVLCATAYDWLSETIADDRENQLPIDGRAQAGFEDLIPTH